MAISPGFYICNSNDLDNLAVSAAYLMRTHPPRDPLSLEQVVVMNRGMQTYLTQVTARLNGIAAQCQYQQLWQLIFRIHRYLYPGADKRNLYSRLYLTLNILGLKPIWAASARKGKPDYFKKMREYLLDDAVGDKAYLLSAKLADTLDQYQMFRPQWVQTWNYWHEADFAHYANDPAAPGVIHDFIVKTAKGDKRLMQVLHNNVWQMHLWCLLRQNLAPKVIAGEGDAKQDLAVPISAQDDPLLYLDRAGIMRNLQQILNDDTLPPERFAVLPEKVFIFGVSALPPQVIDFLQALSRHCAVFLLLLNPCMEYWGDLTSSFSTFFTRFKRARALQSPKLLPEGEQGLASPDLSYLKSSSYEKQGATEDGAELIAGNALLLGLGRQGMDNLALLCALDPMPQFIDSFTDPGSDSLLHQIQHQLLTLEPPSGAKEVIATDDLSLEVHVCHTKLREVQAVRDAILRRFAMAQARGETLSPRDIVVMVPTINAYAPYITAVFGKPTLEGQERDPNFLPYAICDRTQVEESPITDAVLTLLNISVQKISNVLITDLLSIEPLAARFGIMPDDINVIEGWFSAGAVYWGLDDKDTQSEAAISLPGTFEHGLDRMLLGTMGGDLPQAGAYAEIEGEDAQLLGRLCAFIAALKELRSYFTPHLQLPPQDWYENLQTRILDNFFVFDEDNAHERSAILDAVSELQDICRDLATAPQITLPIFHALLSAQLSAQRNYQPFLRGKINFCSLVPMRAVPFKHIFILGLNDGDFPRRERMPGFNLLALSGLYQRGDRSRALDDRFLFLDALISARESIYFSYIGESPISQQELPPSVVLTELLDYIAAHFKVGVDGDGGLDEILPRLLIKEHLAAYNPDNFRYRAEEGHAVRYPSFAGEMLITSSDSKREHPILGACAEWGFTLEKEQSLDLGVLASFLSEPCKLFLRRNLQIYLDSSSTADLSADEDFERSDFDNATLVQEMVLQPPAVAANILQYAQVQGTPPYGAFAHLNADKIQAHVQAMQQGLMLAGIKDLKALQAFQASGLMRTIAHPTQTGQELRFNLNTAALVHVVGKVHTLVQFYPYAALKDDKMTVKPRLQALMMQIGYYLKTGHLASCLLVDINGRVLRLNARSGAEYEQILTQALEFYALGMLRPLPVCAQLLRRLSKLKDEEDDLTQVLSIDADTLYLSADFSYLFGDGTCLLSDKDLAALFSQVAQFCRDNLKVEEVCA